MSGEIWRDLCAVLSHQRIRLAGCFLTKSFVEYARAWSASRSTCSTLVKTSIEDLMRMGVYTSVAPRSSGILEICI